MGERGEGAVTLERGGLVDGRMRMGGWEVPQQSTKRPETETGGREPCRCGGRSVPGRGILERLQGAEEKVSVAREGSARKELHRCAGGKGREASGPFQALLHAALWLYTK